MLSLSAILHWYHTLPLPSVGTGPPCIFTVEQRSAGPFLGPPWSPHVIYSYPRPGEGTFGNGPKGHLCLANIPKDLLTEVTREWGQRGPGGRQHLCRDPGASPRHSRASVWIRRLTCKLFSGAQGWSSSAQTP